MAAASGTPWWSWAGPALGGAVLAAMIVVGGSAPLAALASVALIAAVFAGVHHAEVIAHRVGEPFGTLVLAMAVTIIEVALIVSVMQGGGKPDLARDTVFAAVMIVCNGIIGVCLLAGGMRHREQAFQLEGASAALAVLAALTTLTMILPNFTLTTPGPVFSTPQLVFDAAVSLILVGAFIFVQTVRHRDYFLPVGGGEDAHAEPPSNATVALSAVLLLAALVVVVGLAKALTPTIEAGIRAFGAPQAFVGVIIAALVLMPETLAAYRAARANRLQTSLNLALGSVLATIGFTIPAVAAASVATGQRLELGLDPKDEVLLLLTLLVGVITLGTGRTTVLQGIVHLVIFAVFLFFSVLP